MGSMGYNLDYIQDISQGTLSSLLILRHLPFKGLFFSVFLLVPYVGLVSVVSLIFKYSPFFGKVRFKPVFSPIS